jgi:predicted  nucleic acid-binding Zn-ribbon protein
VESNAHNQVMGEITELKVGVATLATEVGHVVKQMQAMQLSLDKLTPRYDSDRLETRIAHIERQFSEFKPMLQTAMRRARVTNIALVVSNVLWAASLAIFIIFWRSK